MLVDARRSNSRRNLRADRLICSRGGTSAGNIQAVSHIVAQSEVTFVPDPLMSPQKTEVDSGKRVGVPTDMAEKLKALERENCELRQANEILRKASAYFAQAELDRK
jgi:transposase